MWLSIDLCMDLWILTSIPPLLNVPFSLRVNSEVPFTESPVIVALEEVVLAVLPEEASTRVPVKPSPLFQDALWVLGVNMRLLSRFKSPVVVTLEEVHLVVGRGERGCVQIAWDSRETVRYRLWVAALPHFVGELPVLVALEYVGAH